jgi:hypothetical protein
MLQTIASIIPLRNLLINREYSRYNPNSILSHVESIMKKVWSINFGELRPRGFDNLIESKLNMKK